MKVFWARVRAIMDISLLRFDDIALILEPAASIALHTSFVHKNAFACFSFSRELQLGAKVLVNIKR